MTTGPARPRAARGLARARRRSARAASSCGSRLFAGLSLLVQPQFIGLTPVLALTLGAAAPRAAATGRRPRVRALVGVGLVVGCSRPARAAARRPRVRPGRRATRCPTHGAPRRAARCRCGPIPRRAVSQRADSSAVRRRAAPRAATRRAVARGADRGATGIRRRRGHLAPVGRARARRGHRAAAAARVPRRARAGTRSRRSRFDGLAGIAAARGDDRPRSRGGAGGSAPSWTAPGAPRRARAEASALGRRHSAIARSARTATTPVPTAPMTAPTIGADRGRAPAVAVAPDVGDAVAERGPEQAAEDHRGVGQEERGPASDRGRCRRRRAPADRNEGRPGPTAAERVPVRAARREYARAPRDLHATLAGCRTR